MPANDERIDLYDGDTGDRIGPATPEQAEAGDLAAERDGGYGFFLVNADGDPVAAGSWDAQQPGTRKVYTVERDD